MIELSNGTKKLVFTGDLGASLGSDDEGVESRSREERHLVAGFLRGAETITDASYLVMESVYGDRMHESHETSVARLEDTLEETISNRGAVLIPAFSIERTQLLLYHLNELIEKGRIPRVPVFLDSPLAIKATEIYRRATKNFRSEVQAVVQGGDDIFDFPGLTSTLSGEESRDIEQTPNPKIIIAGSGMSNGGRIVYHEKRHLPDPKSAIILVGYQAPGSLGRSLEEGRREVYISGEKVPVRARVAMLRGFSAHRDGAGLFDFVSETANTLERAFIVMGEPKSSSHLAQRMRDYLGVNALVPEEGNMYTIDF
jgi:metallo-beta-lactamase family protein